MQVRRHFIVLGPEGLLEDRQLASIDGLAFVVSAETVEDCRVGDGIEEGPRVVLAEQSPGNFPGFPPRWFGRGEVALECRIPPML